MCGGLASALGLKDANHNYILSYHAGRISSDTLAGVILGLLGYWLSELLNALIVLRIASAIMLILMGLYLTRWLNLLIFTEKAGAVFWRYIRPIGQGFLRPSSQLEAFLLGSVWGWLPCGLVYSALIYASAQGSASGAASTMVAFGLGTLPSMLGATMAGQKLNALLSNTLFRSLAGLTLIGFGCWNLYQPLA